MKTKTHLVILIFIATIVSISPGFSQTVYKISETDTVAIKLKGTSTLHDWEMDANKAAGEAQFLFGEGNGYELISVKSLTFILEVEDLKSNSKGLDKNAYKALKVISFKNIRFQLSSGTLSNQTGSYLLKTKGQLTVAGVIKDVSLDIQIIVNKNDTVTCKGEYKIKMTDHNVEPPSFMMGIMTTGDMTLLSFDVTYGK